MKSKIVLKSDTSSPLTRTGGIIGVFYYLKIYLIDQYVFGTVLVLSSFALILATYLSLDSIISEVHSFAWKYRASLLLAVGLLWYILVNLNRFFKDRLIDLLIHSGVLQSILFILWETKLWDIFNNVSDRILHLSLQFRFWKVLVQSKLYIDFWILQYLHFCNPIFP